MSRILLVEDDKSLGATLRDRLSKEDHQVVWAKTLSEASEVLEKETLDLAVLDVGLPDGSGFELAERLRRNKNMPFIFMTAASDAENRLQGFELGAEEFIPKPFHLKELLLRVKHVLDSHLPAQRVEVEGVTIDLDQLMIRAQGKERKLQSKEFLLLKILIDHSPRVVSREEILDRIWGQEQYPSQRTVDNVILRIRQALGSEAGAWICSVRGIGYQWISPQGEKDGQ